MADPADLPCLSLYAPWAWAIMHAGKDVENRSGNFARRYRGQEVIGRVWIQASLWPGRGPLTGQGGFNFGSELAVMLDHCNDFAPPDIAHICDAMRGHIVGSVEVVGYRLPYEPVRSHWYAAGKLGIMLAEPTPLKTPVPAKGKQGWWSPDEATKAALRAQLEPGA